jgi:methionine synthase II (cobalamin-independent)
MQQIPFWPRLQPARCGALLSAIAICIKKTSLEAHICYKVEFQKKLDIFPESWIYGVNIRADDPDMGCFRPYWGQLNGMPLIRHCRKTSLIFLFSS